MIRVSVHGAQNHSRFFYEEHIQKCTPTPKLENETCPVCLEAFKQGQTLWRLVRCQHVFHDACAEHWIARQPNCPLCRTTVHTPPRPNKSARMLAYHSESDSDDYSSEPYYREDE